MHNGCHNRSEKKTKEKIEKISKKNVGGAASGQGAIIKKNGNKRISLR